MSPSPGQRFRCTLVVPTYNAAAFIAETVLRLRRFAAENPGWCVLFVCDGCTDGTERLLADALTDDGPTLRVESYAENRGKGYALRRGLSLADTPFRFYTDVDLAYDPDEAVKLLPLLESGADLAMANRANLDSRFVVSPRDFPRIYRRHLISRALNWWLQRMLPITIHDTQAGLKGMTAAAWERIGPHMTTDGFFFDVELLARAGAAGLKLAEAPVRFTYVDPSTVRLVSHGWSMFKDTRRLRRRLRREARESGGDAHANQPAVGLAK
jgi:dolichyl-phosphate beta-glucosyltransferase